jgi:D-alanyl-lipoteichoic acid acyltransferase DltB (MBOAT superfamily)
VLFNSFEFLIFLPIVFLLYWFVFNKSLKNQNILILVASYFFYGWWSIPFLYLLIGITIIDYYLAFEIENPVIKTSKFWLALSVILNLGILGIFKYYNFFIDQFQVGFNQLGIHASLPLLKIGLPIGISFYIFHGLSYLIDVYRKQQTTVKSLIDYGVFVSFFPLLVAGPIERASHLLPQVQKNRTFNYAQAVAGCRLILWGLFKKVVVADTISKVVDSIYSNYQTQDAYTLILCAVLFSFQIYGDFSGYSDIALGTAKLFGFELLSNFKFPYFSRNIAEFWRRWHVSLSSWFRDYLYIPLGGSKLGKYISIRNTFIIFLVSGFWHGANWTFIVWGLIHALGFLPSLLLNSNRKFSTNVVAQNTILPSFLELFQMIQTFVFVTIAWIFFRAKDIETANQYIKKIFTSIIEQPGQFLAKPGLTDPYGVLNALWYVVPVILFDWIFRKNERELFANIPTQTLRWILYFIIGLFIAFFFGTKSSFIYFQF